MGWRDGKPRPGPHDGHLGIVQEDGQVGAGILLSGKKGGGGGVSDPPLLLSHQNMGENTSDQYPLLNPWVGTSRADDSLQVGVNRSQSEGASEHGLCLGRLGASIASLQESLSKNLAY